MMPRLYRRRTVRVASAALFLLGRWRVNVASCAVAERLAWRCAWFESSAAAKRANETSIFGLDRAGGDVAGRCRCGSAGRCEPDLVGLSFVGWGPTGGGLAQKTGVRGADAGRRRCSCSGDDAPAPGAGPYAFFAHQPSTRWRCSASVSMNERRLSSDALSSAIVSAVVSGGMTLSALRRRLRALR